ncbi:hypothetical protein Syun_031486 [Stephania yunnanensis]|uniref:Uncharacterized protein n=1 Tax=Stephania yunnanensis TaxID=152371 RepID=A0AAP0DZL5_9MAGN
MQTLNVSLGVIGPLSFAYGHKPISKINLANCPCLSLSLISLNSPLFLSDRFVSLAHNFSRLVIDFDIRLGGIDEGKEH